MTARRSAGAAALCMVFGAIALLLPGEDSVSGARIDDAAKKDLAETAPAEPSAPPPDPAPTPAPEAAQPPGPEAAPAPTPEAAKAESAAPPGEPEAAKPQAQPGRTRRGFAIQITNPARNDFRFGRSDIEATVTATDPAVVDKVEFFVDDRLIYIDTEPPYRCVFDFGTDPRSWVIRAVAHHREGVKVEDTVILKRVVLNYAVSVNRVIVYGTAIDKKKERFYRDLAKDKVVLKEDGVRQHLVDFYLETRPMTLAVILDSSGSMQGAIEKVHGAASKFVSTLAAEDKAMVIDFNDQVFLLQDTTNDKEALRSAITSTAALGDTALYDALYASFRRLRGIQGRKAIILLSDGEDTASKFSYKRVLDEAKLADIIIYSIGLGTSALDIDLRRILKTLSEETGGRSYFPDKVDELEEVYNAIAEELKNQYYITYEPTNTIWDGRWRKIEVSVASDLDIEMRARKGYYGVKRPAL